MRTTACLSTLEISAPAPGRSETSPPAVTAPSAPTEAEHSVAPAVIGVALAWLAFFALAIKQALATS